jgi:hypothetical protein
LFIGLYAGAAFAQQVDVSGQVNITKSGLVFNRTTRTFDSVLTLTNSLMPISGPVALVITGITPNAVTLANASGTTTAGRPYRPAAFAAGKDDMNDYLLKPDEDDFLRRDGTNGNAILELTLGVNGKIGALLDTLDVTNSDPTPSIGSTIQHLPDAGNGKGVEIDYQSPSIDVLAAVQTAASHAAIRMLIHS